MNILQSIIILHVMPVFPKHKQLDITVLFKVYILQCLMVGQAMSFCLSDITVFVIALSANGYSPTLFRGMFDMVLYISGCVLRTGH